MLAQGWSYRRRWCGFACWDLQFYDPGDFLSHLTSTSQ
jgi:hypothetical protein